MWFFTLIGIMGHLPSVKEDEKGFSFYQWDISNKYYDASIHFCQMTTKMVVDEDFSENVNASIIFFNSLEVRKTSMNNITNIYKIMNSQHLLVVM
jgi:hypothetical protein